MLSYVIARNYRGFSWLRQPIKPFQVLIGPSGSGKSTFLEIPFVLARLVANGSSGLEYRYGDNIDSIITQHSTNRDEYSIGVEVNLPRFIPPMLSHSQYEAVSYYIRLKRGIENSSIIVGEKLRLIPNGKRTRSSEWRTVLHRQPDGMTVYRSEWDAENTQSMRRAISTHTSLGLVHPDDPGFLTTTWFRDYLLSGIRRFDTATHELDRCMAKPVMDQIGKRLYAAGARNPWHVHELQTEYPDRFHDWVKHLQVAEPRLQDVGVQSFPGGLLGVIVKYRNGTSVTCGGISASLLRLMAATLPAYLVQNSATFIGQDYIETGLQPDMISAAMDSAKSLYDSQCLLQTASPLVVNEVSPADLLCFRVSKNNTGSTITSGDVVLASREWKGSPDLGTMFVAGLLAE